MQIIRASPLREFEVENTPCYYITDQVELENTVKQLADEPLLAVDTEFLRTNTFYPIAGLIQIASYDVCYLIDPISCTDLEPLKTLLYAPNKRLVMHACSEDLEVFMRLFGGIPDSVFDTQVAASMVSRDHQLGLQKLILSYCGKEIPKDQTRSDWTKRPLTEQQKVYAALDVVCLLQVYDALAEKLDTLGRMDWCVEDCARLASKYGHEADYGNYYRSIGDAWKLNGKNLQVLQALAQWREELAHTKDKPRGFIFSDRELFALASKLPKNNPQLAAAGDFKPVQIRRYGEQAIAIIQQVLNSEREPLASVPKPFSNSVKKAAKKVKPLVEERALELDMATDRLASRRYLEKLIKAKFEGRALPSYFQGWRSQELVPKLSPLLEKLSSDSADE